MKRQGFTLLELLIVISILAVLAAMLLPVFLQAKETAKMRACMSNLKQIGVAFRQYLDDNQGYGLPISPPEYRSKWNLYVKPLLPYFKEPATRLYTSGAGVVQAKRVWICPGDVRKHGMNNPVWAELGSSYRYPGLGAYISAEGNRDVPLNIKPFTPRKPDQWLRPSRDMIAADWAGGFHTSGQTTDVALDKTVDAADAVRSFNVIMLDLHTVSCSRAELGTGAGLQKSFTYTDYVLYEDNPYSGSSVTPGLIP